MVQWFGRKHFETYGRRSSNNRLNSVRLKEIRSTMHNFFSCFFFFLEMLCEYSRCIHLFSAKKNQYYLLWLCIELEEPIMCVYFTNWLILFLHESLSKWSLRRRKEKKKWHAFKELTAKKSNFYDNHMFAIRN